MHTHSHVTHPHVVRIRIHRPTWTHHHPCPANHTAEPTSLCVHQLPPVSRNRGSSSSCSRSGCASNSRTPHWRPNDGAVYHGLVVTSRSMARPHSLTAPLRPVAPLALWMRARGANPSEHGRWQCDASESAQGRGVESRARQGEEEEGRRKTTRERERERGERGERALGRLAWLCLLHWQAKGGRQARQPGSP